MFHKCICWLQCSKIDPDLEMFLRSSHSFLGTLAPSDCDLHNGEVVAEGVDGPSSPSSLPSLESVSSSSINSIYYTPAFLQSSQGTASLSPPEVVLFVVQGRSTTLPTLSPSFPGDSGSFGFFDQGVVDETGFTGLSLLGDEGWSSGGSGSDVVDTVGVGYWIGA